MVFVQGWFELKGGVFGKEECYFLRKNHGQFWASVGTFLKVIYSGNEVGLRMDLGSQ